MATNYAQKLERERQSPKGNQTKKENIGGLRKLTTDTGYLKTKKKK